MTRPDALTPPLPFHPLQFDYDGSGFIDYVDMVLYLTSMFKLLFATTSAGDGFPAELTPEDLAEVTAQECFNRYVPPGVTQLP